MNQRKQNRNEIPNKFDMNLGELSDITNQFEPVLSSMRLYEIASRIYQLGFERGVKYQKTKNN